MACTIQSSCFHISRFVPSLFSRNFLLRSDFRRLYLPTSTGGSFLFSSKVVRHPAPAVYAQAKRGLSTKEDEVASAADLHFETPLRIVEYPDPILRAKNKRIGTFDDNLKKLVDEMFDIMYKTDGIGLSAPQVGFLFHRTDGIGLSAPQVSLNVQLMVFNPVGERGEGEEIILVNPSHQILKKSGSIQ